MSPLSQNRQVLCSAVRFSYLPFSILSLFVPERSFVSSGTPLRSRTSKYWSCSSLCFSFTYVLSFGFSLIFSNQVFSSFSCIRLLTNFFHCSSSTLPSVPLYICTTWLSADHRFSSRSPTVVGFVRKQFLECGPRTSRRSSPIV